MCQLNFLNLFFLFTTITAKFVDLHTSRCSIYWHEQTSQRQMLNILHGSQLYAKVPLNQYGPCFPQKYYTNTKNLASDQLIFAHCQWQRNKSSITLTAGDVPIHRTSPFTGPPTLTGLAGNRHPVVPAKLGVNKAKAVIGPKS